MLPERGETVRPLQILPAIDLRGGMVVHAVAGRREAYRPLVSRLCASPVLLFVPPVRQEPL